MPPVLLPGFLLGDKRAPWEREGVQEREGEGGTFTGRDLVGQGVTEDEADGLGEHRGGSAVLTVKMGKKRPGIKLR